MHESRHDEVLSRLSKIYASVRIGDPLAEGTLVGPLVNQRAVEGFVAAVEAAKAEGGTVAVGGRRATSAGPGNFVEPTIITGLDWSRTTIAKEETFAPILYVFKYRDLNEAIAMNNDVPQGLSSAIFSDSLRATERFRLSRNRSA